MVSFILLLGLLCLSCTQFVQAAPASAARGEEGERKGGLSSSIRNVNQQQKQFVSAPPQLSKQGAAQALTESVEKYTQVHVQDEGDEGASGVPCTALNFTDIWPETDFHLTTATEHIIPTLLTLRFANQTNGETDLEAEVTLETAGDAFNLHDIPIPYMGDGLKIENSVLTWKTEPNGPLTFSCPITVHRTIGTVKNRANLGSAESGLISASDMETNYGASFSWTAMQYVPSSISSARTKFTLNMAGVSECDFLTIRKDNEDGVVIDIPQLRSKWTNGFAGLSFDNAFNGRQFLFQFAADNITRLVYPGFQISFEHTEAADITPELAEDDKTQVFFHWEVEQETVQRGKMFRGNVTIQELVPSGSTTELGEMGIAFCHRGRNGVEWFPQSGRNCSASSWVDAAPYECTAHWEPSEDGDASYKLVTGNSTRIFNVKLANGGFDQQTDVVPVSIGSTVFFEIDTHNVNPIPFRLVPFIRSGEEIKYLVPVGPASQIYEITGSDEAGLYFFLEVNGGVIAFCVIAYLIGFFAARARRNKKAQNASGSSGMQDSDDSATQAPLLRDDVSSSSGSGMSGSDNNRSVA